MVVNPGSSRGNLSSISLRKRTLNVGIYMSNQDGSVSTMICFHHFVVQRGFTLVWQSVVYQVAYQNS